MTTKCTLEESLDILQTTKVHMTGSNDLCEYCASFQKTCFSFFFPDNCQLCVNNLLIITDIINDSYNKQMSPIINKWGGGCVHVCLQMCVCVCANLMTYPFVMFSVIRGNMAARLSRGHKFAILLQMPFFSHHLDPPFSCSSNT